MSIESTKNEQRDSVAVHRLVRRILMLALTSLPKQMVASAIAEMSLRNHGFTPMDWEGEEAWCPGRDAGDYGLETRTFYPADVCLSAIARKELCLPNDQMSHGENE